MVLGSSPFRIVSDNFPRQPRWLPLLKIENSAKNHLKMILSETVGPKLWWNGLRMVLFENCVRWPQPPTKIAAVTKNRKFGKKSLKNYLLWNYGANWAQTMVEWSLGGHLSELCPTTPAANQDCQFSKRTIENSAKNNLKIISSETAGPIGPKLWWNGL
jgi:hypothetical protein